MAIAIGFLGMLVIVRPGGVGFRPATLLILVAALAYAVMMLLARWMTRPERPHESSSSFVFYMLAGQAAVGWLVAAGAWRTPDAWAMAQMAAMGVFAILGNYGLAEAFRTAPVAIVAPFEYTGVIWAVAAGRARLRGHPARDVLGGHRHHRRRRPVHAARGGGESRMPVAAPSGRRSLTVRVSSFRGGRRREEGDRHGRAQLDGLAGRGQAPGRGIDGEDDDLVRPLIAGEQPAASRVDAEAARGTPAGRDVLDEREPAAGRVAREHRDVVRATLGRVDEAAARVDEDLGSAVRGGDRPLPRAGPTRSGTR